MSYPVSWAQVRRKHLRDAGIGRGWFIVSHIDVMAPHFPLSGLGAMEALLDYIDIAEDDNGVPIRPIRRSCLSDLHRFTSGFGGRVSASEAVCTLLLVPSTNPTNPTSGQYRSTS